MLISLLHETKVKANSEEGQAIIKFFFGLLLYSQTLKVLKKKTKSYFRDTLSSLSEDTIYELMELRKKIRDNEKLHPLDRYVISLLPFKDKKQIQIIEYPTFYDVYMNIKKVAISKAATCAWHFKYSDQSIGINDILSELYIKSLQTYRKYIFSLGSLNYNGRQFNENVFYSCIILSLSNQLIDLKGRMKAQKRITISSTIPLEYIYDENS